LTVRTVVGVKSDTLHAERKLVCLVKNEAAVVAGAKILLLDI
jgi:hypothetical protein